MSITTLSLLKKQAVIDHTDDDELLQHYLDTAEAWIFEHIAITPLPLPAPVKQAVFMFAAYLYEQREAVAAGVSMDSVPFGVLDLIRPYRAWSFTNV